jgi:mannosyltransferase
MPRPQDTPVGLRWACRAGAAVLFALAVLLPADLAQDLPSRRDAIAIVPDLQRAPISGATLLRLCLALDALLLLAWGQRAGRRPAAQAAFPGDGTGPPAPTRGEGALVGGLTALALVLRLYHAGSDLWVDEIVNLHIFREIPALHIVASYRIINNHLMNTLLVKAAAAAFGEAEWAVRLPAILWGTLTVPALWAASRSALGRHGALLAALLLALSYHHIFYSQNARGYSGLVFFSVAATGLLGRALRSGRPSAWAAYLAAVLGAVASMLLGFFVLAGHAVAAALALVVPGRRGAETTGRRLREAAVFFGLAAYLAVHLYALVLPDAVVSVATVYRGSTMGYRVFSAEHLGEWARGLAAGAGPGGLAAVAVFLLAGAVGIVRAYRRDPVLVGGLAWPVLLTGAAVVVGGLNVTPRSFLLGLPLALVGGVSTLGAVVDRLAALRPGAPGLGRRLTVAAAVILAAASAAALPAYYRSPKQDFRGAIRHVESLRSPQDLVLAVYLSKAGFWHYAPRLGLREGRDFAVVQSVEEIERLKRDRPDARLFAVTTLVRGTRLEYPDLQPYIEAHFRLLRRFPGTLGDGDVAVWAEAPRDAASGAGGTGPATP